LRHEENIFFVGYSRPFPNFEKGTFGKALLNQEHPIHQNIAGARLPHSGAFGISRASFVLKTPMEKQKKKTSA
jgi:hypothetical protein